MMSYQSFVKNIARRITPAPLRYLARKILNYRLRGLSSAQYWTRHNVTGHQRFSSPQDSLDQLNWRNSQYPGYIELMPVDQARGKVVLDFGCGPGNDLVGFAVHSTPARLIGADVSPTSLAEADARVKLHGYQSAEVILLDEAKPLPLEDRSIDLIHCSGVLHHLPDMDRALREFRRLIKDDGLCQIMVYNHHSIWMQLYASYIYRTQFPWRARLSKTDVFKVTTDGEECPIVTCFTPDDFCAIAERVGFRAKFIGAAISLNEMNWIQLQFQALKDPSLDAESRAFLSSLTFNERGFPLYRGQIAGIDGCFRLTPA
jgi:SAM-dependent methyltransferase